MFVKNSNVACYLILRVNHIMVKQLELGLKKAGKIYYFDPTVWK